MLLSEYKYYFSWWGLNLTSTAPHIRSPLTLSCIISSLANGGLAMNIHFLYNLPAIWRKKHKRTVHNQKAIQTKDNETDIIQKGKQLYPEYQSFSNLQSNTSRFFFPPIQTKENAKYQIMNLMQTTIQTDYINIYIPCCRGKFSFETTTGYKVPRLLLLQCKPGIS